MTCTHRLHDGPLRCTNEQPHEPGHGCTYRSDTGSEVPDRHDPTSGGEH